MTIQINKNLFLDELKHKKALFKELSKQKEKAFPSMRLMIEKRLIELDCDIKVLNQRIRNEK